MLLDTAGNDGRKDVVAGLGIGARPVIRHFQRRPASGVGRVAMCDVVARFDDLVLESDGRHAVGIGHLGRDRHRLPCARLVRSVIDLPDLWGGVYVVHGVYLAGRYARIAAGCSDQPGIEKCVIIRRIRSGID